MYTEVHAGGQKLSPLALRFRNVAAEQVFHFFDFPKVSEWRTQVLLLREVILLCPALAGPQRRRRRKILAYDKRRYRNTASKSLWSEAPKRRIMVR
jgi:hypothetical protein